MTFATEGPKVPENSGLQERQAKAGCERKEASRIHRKNGNNRALGTHIPRLRISVAAVWLPEVSVSSEGLRW